MGTNYYWHDRPCDHCGRSDVVHVFKSGGNWRAYLHQLMDADHPDWGYLHQSPFGYQVASVADWRRVFTERPGELWNEYGDRIPDPLAWLDSIKPPDDDHKARLIGWHQRDLDDGTDWFDPEGYFFHAGEFS
jgi:hypothetical protein